MPDVEGGPEGPAPVQSPLARLAQVAMGVAFLPFFVVVLGLAPSCLGFRDPALTLVNACPSATAALGTPVAQAWVGLSYGNAETEDDEGRAGWSMPVAGPNGRGTLDIHAVERGGRWEFARLVLTAGDRTIDVVSCAAGGSGELIAVTHRDLTGTVGTIVGQPGVTTGAACSITIDPAPEGGVQNCHVVVACGGTTLYGAGGGGFGQCTTDASGATMMEDAHPTSDDHDPMLDLRLGAHEVVVTDQTPQGTWVVTIATP